MDPDTALAELLAETVMLRAAIDLRDPETTARSLRKIAEQAEGLAAWIDSGGYLPSAST